MRKDRDIKLLTIAKTRNYLVSESNYHTTKSFTKNFFAIEMKKTEIYMNKPVYLGLSILWLSKIAVHDFWYDYFKPKYVEKGKLCYADTNSFVAYIKNMIFVNTLQKMLKQGLILQIMN